MTKQGPFPPIDAASRLVRHEDGVVVIGHLGVALEMGTFVILDRIFGRNYYSLGRILSWEKAGDLGTRIHIQLLHLTDRNMENRAGDPGPLWKHMCLARWTKEVAVASPGHILQVAWVFPASLLLYSRIQAQGRRTCFAILDEGVSPFPCFNEGCRVSTSYARRIWQDLDQIWVVMKKMVLSEANRTSKRAAVPISNDGWQYLYTNADLLDVEYESDVHASTKVCGQDMTKVEFEMFPGMDYGSIRRECKYDRVTLTGTVGMFIACALFGEGSFIGIKKRKPSLASCKTGPLFLSELDNCLYGQKLVLTHFCGQVVMEFQYSVWQYRANEEGFPTQCPCCNLERYITRSVYPGDDLPMYPTETPATVSNMEVDEEDYSNDKENADVSAMLKVNNTFPVGEKGMMYRIANNALNDEGEVLFVSCDPNAEASDEVVLSREDAITCATNYFLSN